ncbi:MAG: RnfABCDGE type electron transport complex subunit D [Chitinispirillaceae bacterium]|nr:RnfABCDGE type electron transport complex subunit D [Chitinispirillaceae bacterium]
MYRHRVQRQRPGNDDGSQEEPAIMTNEQQPTKEPTNESPMAADGVKIETFQLTASPHLRQPESVSHIMMWVVIALLPSLAAGVVFFGPQALLLTVVSVLAAIVTEWAIVKFLKKSAAIGDFSAVVTGVLVAFNVSSTLPWWMAAIGSAFAIGVAKMTFGGLGANFINPALAGRAFLMAAYPSAMTRFSPTTFGSLSGIDGISSATPLAQFKAAMADGSFQALDFQDALSNLFLGNVGGCLGETSALALLAGGILLLYKRIIPLRIPLVYIGTVFLLSWIFNGTGAHFTSSAIIIPFYHILAGGLFLGAFFMATDMVTSPITPAGKIVFAAGCGVLTFLIRKFGGYPEGVSYSILLMNLFVPLIERSTRPKMYGKVKNRD